MSKTGRPSWATIAESAVQFSKTWQKRKPDEKSEGQNFIRSFLTVFGADLGVGEFESKVKTPDGRTNWIDFYWKGKIAIEMKSKGKSLDTAMEQLRGYMELLPEGEEPPDIWMVSDFENIRILHRATDHDSHMPTEEAFTFKAANLKKHVRHFAALADHEREYIKTDKESVNVSASKKMAKLHEALESYGYRGHDLQVYVARLLFCLFADDTGIFPQGAFYHYVNESQPNGKDLSGRLAQLFQDLNQEDDKRTRNAYLLEDSAVKSEDFRYINGGLFSENLNLASFDQKMRQTLLDCLEFDWSQISPAIFGSMFQDVMEGGARREIGAHYTSEENILKLIDPLFMDALREEFAQAKKKGGQKAMGDFHDKLARLKFLDPACGCGNFLIIAYRELRRLELEVVKEEIRLSKASGHKLLNIETHFRVGVGQFYGIEIEEWPCQIATTGMWLMDHLMNMEASEEFGEYYDRLPLTKSATIVHANAHRIEWGSVAPKGELSYIMGNPPYVGYTYQTDVQRCDILLTCLDGNGKPIRGAGKMDYVVAWFYRAAKYMQGTHIRAAFVSTNSITQGEQVAALWRPLVEDFGIHIDFAYRTFKWSNEAKGKAAVHCVIVGFSHQGTGQRSIYDGEEKTPAKSINPYLVDAGDIFVESRTEPLCGAPEMVYGNKPADGGHLIIEAKDYWNFIEREPSAKPYIKRLTGSDEFINNKERHCLWLVGAPPAELRKMPLVMERVEKCRQMRLASPKKATRESASTPTLFQEVRQADSDYILIPRVSSERRNYIPMGFMLPDVVATDSAHMVPYATLYHFGILTSSVHMAWTRAVCGRLKSDYRYSKDIVYNNFPWPDATDKQKAEIERLAQGVLDARANYPDSSLADLYDPLTMPPDLSKAHSALDRAVIKLYGFGKDMTEPEIVAALMERYKELARVQGVGGSLRV